ncbi:MAG: gluconate:H+ symporter [Bacteroidota bacterium]
MPLITIALGILVLLILIIGLRFNAFIALILVSLGIGVALGMEITDVIESIKKGVGSTLGYLALILGFGAMLGALIAESGAAQNITTKLIDKFGVKNVHWAVILTGFIVGVPMFYSVGFIMLIPIIFAIAQSTRLPILYVGIPMVASLSVTHGFLPPHPAPTAIAVIYGADISLTLLYGIIIGIPTIIIAGPIFGSTLRNFQTKEPPKNLFPLKEIPEDQLPSLSVSIFTALIPVLLMAASAVAKLTLPEEAILAKVLNFLGDPVIAILLAVLVAIYTLGIATGKNMKEVMDSLAESVKIIAMIILIIGAGGAFKQVLVDSGTGDYITGLMAGSNISPLLLAWCIAAALRVALGSATVAALTAGGIVAPLIGATDVNPELLVLATGAGSLTLSNVNDTGFWLFKEYFNLTIMETFRSWTMMETIVSVVGLIGCLLLNMIL